MAVLAVIRLGSDRSGPGTGEAPNGFDGGAFDRLGPGRELLAGAHGWLGFVRCSAGAGTSAGTPGAGWPVTDSGGSTAAGRRANWCPNRRSPLRRLSPALRWGSLRGVPFPSVLAVYARAVSRSPIRSSRSWLTAAVSRRDRLSPRRAARPRREVRRAPASGRLRAEPAGRRGGRPGYGRRDPVILEAKYRRTLGGVPV